MPLFSRRPDPRLEADPERLPPGQVLTEKWPVLHYGSVPRYDLGRWRLRVLGEVEEERTLSHQEVRALPASDVVLDIHCVTTWSRFDNRFTGVRFDDFARLMGMRPSTRYVEFQCYGGFTTSVPVATALDPQALLAWAHDGADLAPEHGHPLRAVMPRRYFWKSAKWLEAVEFRVEDRLGFWERNGYNNSADPWLEERYW